MLPKRIGLNLLLMESSIQIHSMSSAQGDASSAKTIEILELECAL